jgi:hypothetical protein
MTKHIATIARAQDCLEDGATIIDLASRDNVIERQTSPAEQGGASTGG